MIFGFLNGKERRGAAFGLAAAGILLTCCLGCPGGTSPNDAARKESEKIPVLTAILSPEREAELKLTAENGDVKAQYQLGNYYHELYNETSYNDIELQRLYKDEAVKWLTKAAENNCADAQIELSGAYHSLGSNICYLNYIEAARWIVRAAEQNNPEAMYKLGWYYYITGGSLGASHDIVLRHDYYKAFKWWRRAAELGNAEAQFKMGNFYHKLYYDKFINGYYIGLLSEKQPLNGKERLAKAEKWYKAAASQGHERAKNDLEELNKAIKDYDAIKRSSDIINKLKTKSGEKFAIWEYPLSVFDIGDFDPDYKLRFEYFYNFKDIFTVDRTRFVMRLLKDARKGNYFAQSMLAKMYEGMLPADKSIEGLPVEKRLEEAEKWYNAAAESGNVSLKKKADNFQRRVLLREKSCMNTLSAEEKYEVGRLYSEDNGILFAYNPEKSLDWMQQSAQEGFAEAQYELAEFFASRVYLDDALKSDDISKAEKWYEAAAGQGHKDAEKRLEAIKQVEASAAAKAENSLSADDEYRLSRLIDAFPLLLSRQEARQYLFNAAKRGSRQARDEIIKTADSLSDPHSARYDSSYDELASRLKKATEYYKAACAYGDAHAQNRLAEINRQSDEHLQRINSLSKKVSEGKADDDDLRKLAELYINNRFAHRSPQKAAELKCELAQKGYSKDAQDLRRMLSAVYRDKSEPYSIFEVDYIDRYNDNFDIKAFRQQEAALKKEAAAGSIEASYKLGVLYYSAKESSIIYRGSRLSAARKYWREAALKGHVGAQYCLGRISDEESVKWLLMAADSGDAPAMYELSLLIYNNAVKESFTVQNADPKKAFELCLKSAEKGYPKAQLLLGNMYAGGTGVKADPAEAEKWYERAMRNGNYVAGFYYCLSKYGLINYL